MATRWKGEDGSDTEVKIEGTALRKVSEYKYLGSVVQDNGELEKEVCSKIQGGWARWKEVSGVLCDRRVPAKLKGKLYTTAVRPAMTYSSECWAMKQRQEQMMHVAEMRMLRLMCGVTRKDRVRNEKVRGSVGVACMADKLAEARLRWFGHVVRKREEDVVKRVWRMDEDVKLQRGRPEQTWRQVVRKDMKNRDLQEELANDRKAWRVAIHIPTPINLGYR